VCPENGRPGCEFSFSKVANRLHILGLPAFRAFDHIELHLLPFLQAAKSAGLNRREMHTHVLAVLAADETIPLASLNHFTVPVSINVARSFWLNAALKLSRTSRRRSCCRADMPEAAAKIKRS
jgi:hypothetical protein